MTVTDLVSAGCAPGRPDCNQPPPTDGYVLFWAPILLGVLCVLAVSVVAMIVWRRRHRPLAPRT